MTEETQGTRGEFAQVLRSIHDRMRDVSEDAVYGAVFETESVTGGTENSFTFTRIISLERTARSTESASTQTASSQA